jgi:hypothetical protein
LVNNFVIIHLRLNSGDREAADGSDTFRNFPFGSRTISDFIHWEHRSNSDITKTWDRYAKLQLSLNWHFLRGILNQRSKKMNQLINKDFKRDTEDETRYVIWTMKFEADSKKKRKTWKWRCRTIWTKNDQDLGVLMFLWLYLITKRFIETNLW